MSCIYSKWVKQNNNAKTGKKIEKLNIKLAIEERSAKLKSHERCKCEDSTSVG